MRKLWIWIAASLAILVAVILMLEFAVDRPLRGYMETRINNRLKGYTASLGAVDFHLIGFSIDLRDLMIVQDANPDPPVARIPQLTASVQWRALFAARIVADFRFERPSIYINRKQTKKEDEDEVPVEERGWQDALQAIYPLKINQFKIVDGDFTYADEGPFRPLRLSKVNFRAGNIGNVWSPDHVYPSDLYLESVVFDSGKLLFDGQANFLAEPHVGVNGQLTLENVELDYFKPLVARYNFSIRNGTLSGSGNVEYAPDTKVFHLKKLAVEGVQVTYTHTAQSTRTEKKAARKTVEAAQKVNNDPEILLRADQIDIRKSSFSFENKEADPPYRLFLSDAGFHLANFTNHFTEGTAVAKLTGKFMGVGDTTAGATFRPATNGPDFNLAVRIEDTPMQPMNDLWRAYGNFDLVSGVFSFYTELKLKNGDISGYVKPLFKDLNIYDRRQDKGKGLFRQIYEGLIGGIAWLLQNPPRDEVATVTTISGKLENPRTSTWAAILGLVQNAFFKAILPGFERAVGRPIDDSTTRTARATANPKQNKAKDSPEKGNGKKSSADSP